MADYPNVPCVCGDEKHVCLSCIADHIEKLEEENRTLATQLAEAREIIELFKTVRDAQKAFDACEQEGHKVWLPLKERLGKAENALQQALSRPAQKGE